MALRLPNPLSWFSRRLEHGGKSRRALDAAGGGRRWSDDRSRASVGIGTHDAAIIGQRAAYYALNNPTGARIVDALCASIVGTGIKPRSLIENEGKRAALMRQWRMWTDAADADARAEFSGLQDALTRDMVVFGEGLAALMSNPYTGAPQVRRLHPEQLDRSLTRPTTGGGFVYSGVEFGASGRIVAYHIRPHAPNDPATLLPIPAQRIAAADVIHMFRQLLPGQVRGLSWLAPVLLPAKELDALADAMLVRAKVAALFAGVVTDPDGSGVLDGERAGSMVNASLEPGSLLHLEPGKSIEFADTPDQGGAAGLMTSTLRMIAAGAGVTYEQATGDYSQVNYSSARASLLEHRRFIETIQHHVVVFQLCRPVWQRFIRWQVLTGGVPAAAYAADRAAFEAVDWLPPRWDQVDPLKETNAAINQINARLKSRAEYVAERGLDVEDIDRQIAADAARLARLGVATGEAA